MRLYISIFLFFSFAFSVKAQHNIIVSAKSADCVNSIDISGKKSIHATAPKGPGEQMEIKSSKGDLHYFEKELFTVWYSFIAEEDAVMSFIITPDRAEDDYDFILFECADGNCCSAIIDKSLQPVRSNISRTNVAKNGTTGLSSEGSSNFVHEGKGNNFSFSLHIKKGRKYYLVLNNVYGGDNGHRIDFDFEPTAVKQVQKVNNTPMLNLNIVDASSQAMVNAQIVIVHFDENYISDTLLKQENSSLFLPLIIGDYYEIYVTKPQYLLNKVSFKVHDGDSLISKIVELQNVKVGSSFELKKVYFQGGTASFVGNSTTALRKLFYVLKNNPSLEVEIQGHVNLPRGSYKKKPEAYYNQLSIDRAKAVYDYLVKRGIDAERLDYQGFGYSQMVYPDASNSDQMQKNRRVELKIVGN